MPELWRLFVGLPCPAPLRQRLDVLKEELASSDWELKFSDTEGYHVTLHFLGLTEPKLIDDLRKDLGALCHARRPFDLACGGLGCFPDEGDPRVLWAGIDDRQGRLLELYQASRRVLNQYRLFKLEEAYRPHLTLARVKSLSKAWDPQRLRALAHQWEKLGTYPVEQVNIYRSHGSGKTYEVMAELKIGN